MQRIKIDRGWLFNRPFNGNPVYLQNGGYLANAEGSSVNVAQYNNRALIGEQSDQPWSLLYRAVGSSQNDVFTGRDYTGGDEDDPQHGSPLTRLSYSYMLGLDGDDVLYGEADEESEQGDGDFLAGGRGDDMLYGGGGDDVLMAGESPLFLIGDVAIFNDEDPDVDARRALLGIQQLEPAGALSNSERFLNALKSGHAVLETEDEQTMKEQGGLVYSMSLLMEKNTLWVDEREVKLMPGMQVTAEVITHQRRIIEYFLSPIQKHLRESVRER